jgi:uncharacterized protein
LKEVFVDTNLFIRYLTNDDPAKADRVASLLDEAKAGKVRLVTAEMVLAETVWVLESGYGLSQDRIAHLVRAILATPDIEVSNAALVSRALELYETARIDFVDGYIAAVMERRGIRKIFSFDKKHLSRLKHLERREP